MAAASGTSKAITVAFRPRYNEHGDYMLWMASWLTGEHGEEGEWFYSGQGGGPNDYHAPPEAHGIRIRRWPSNGLDPEYVDLEFVDIDGAVTDRGLRFDRRQPFSRLPEDDD